MPHFLAHRFLPSSNNAGWAYIVNCSGIMDVLGKGPSEELGLLNYAVACRIS